MTLTSPIDEEVDTREGWQRLHLRSTITGVKLLLGPLMSLLVGGVLLGRGTDTSGALTFLVLVVVTILGVLLGVAQRRTTRYRIGEELVEAHSGIVFRKERSIPRDRIRTVDLTAPPLHRFLGLVTVRIGSGESQDGDVETVVLDAVGNAEGQRLRNLLLRDVEGKTPSENVNLLTMSWRWLRFAPLSIFSLVAVGVLAGMFDNVTGALDLTQRDIERLGTEVVAQSLLLIVLGATMVIGIVISMVLYVEAWWGFTLTRSEGTLEVQRGLLTQRSVSLDENRLRGVEVREPVLMRFAQGGSLRAVATGVGGGLRGGMHLTPPADLDVVHTLAEKILAEDLPLQERLIKHPEYAIVKRLTRGSIPGLVLGVLAYLSGGVITWTLSLVLLAIGLALGWVSYANLGHQVVEDYLLARRGFLVRKTVALHKDGIVGWVVRSSPFQRRRNMCTLLALTSAGTGGYLVPDVTFEQARDITENLTPGSFHWGTE